MNEYFFIIITENFFLFKQTWNVSLPFKGKKINASVIGQSTNGIITKKNFFFEKSNSNFSKLGIIILSLGIIVFIGKKRYLKIKY